MFGKKSTHRAPVSRLKHFKEGIRLFRGLGPRKYLAYSKAFKKFVQKHPGVMTSAYKMILEMKKVQNPHAQRDHALGISVDPLIVSHANMFNNGLYKVHTGHTTFFVKDSKFEYSHAQRNVWEKANNWLEKQGGEVNGMKVRLLTPHVLYKNFLVSNFYEGAHIKDVAELQGTKRNQLDATIEKINTSLEKEGIFDCKSRNVFYDSEHNTLVLFDLISKTIYDKQVDEANQLYTAMIREGRF